MLECKLTVEEIIESFFPFHGRARYLLLDEAAFEKLVSETRIDKDDDCLAFRYRGLRIYVYRERERTPFDEVHGYIRVTELPLRGNLSFLTPEEMSKTIFGEGECSKMEEFDVIT